MTTRSIILIINSFDINNLDFKIYIGDLHTPKVYMKENKSLGT